MPEAAPNLVVRIKIGRTREISLKGESRPVLIALAIVMMAFSVVGVGTILVSHPTAQSFLRYFSG